MTPPPPAAGRPAVRPRRTAWAVVSFPTFVALLAVWTYLLVKENPIPEVVEEFPLEFRFLAAKCLHAGVYAGLTVFAGLLPLPATVARRARLTLIALLVAHGAGTEYAQTFVPGRTGTKRDVAIDWGGVTAGVVVLWAVRRLS